MCIRYMSLGSNDCFITDTILTDGHYKTVVLCTIAYNIRGTGVVLQVPWDSANPVGKQ
jgi:hypothetical protein